MNLVVDNTVEVNGNERNDIGMVVSNYAFLGPLVTIKTKPYLSNSKHVSPLSLE
jgi:hypothetical protein